MDVAHFQKLGALPGSSSRPTKQNFITTQKHRYPPQKHRYPPPWYPLDTTAAGGRPRPQYHPHPHRVYQYVVARVLSFPAAPAASAGVEEAMGRPHALPAGTAGRRPESSTTHSSAARTRSTTVRGREGPASRNGQQDGTGY
jgi:hypothetical protein